MNTSLRQARGARHAARMCGFLLGCTAFAGLARPAFADDAKAQAKEYYSFGARAFEAGRFRAAAKAFDEAFRLVPRPALLFSAGQALRRQYAVDHQSDDLKKAVDYYRRYIAEPADNPRKNEAATALAELEGMAQRIGLDLAAPATGPSAPEPTAPVPGTPALGVVMVSTSAKGAHATLDGKPVEMPLSAEVPPGKHVIKLTAPGYFDLEREVQIAPGASFATDLTLRQKPARLNIDTDSRADVTLDGRPLGTTPLTGPLDVAPGTRRLVVSQTGHHPFVSDVELKPDELADVPVDLEATGQRYASYGLFAVAGAGAAAGGVLAAIAFFNQNRASKIDDARQAGNISDADRAAYDDAVQRRDDYRRWSAVAFAAGGVVGVGGLFLYLIDSPEVKEPPRKEDERTPGDADGPPDQDPIDMSFVPSAPGADAGGSLSLRF